MAEETDNNGSGGDVLDGIPESKPPGYFEGESLTRRKVFTVAGQAIGGLAVAGVALPAVMFSAAPIFDSPDVEWQPVGPLDEFERDTYKPVVITIVENIGEAGKTTVYVRKGNPELPPSGDNDFPTESPEEIVAITTRCAHLGCPVRFVEAANNFICPCHGGVYGFRGEVIGGPPVRPLDRFQARVQNGVVEIGPRFSVTSSLDSVRSRDPGQFTGGIWEYLYPPRPSTPPAP